MTKINLLAIAILVSAFSAKPMNKGIKLDPSPAPDIEIPELRLSCWPDKDTSIRDPFGPTRGTFDQGPGKQDRSCNIF